MELDIDVLSKQIARGIFEAGDGKDSPTTRIQFISGKYPDNEKTQGGFNEAALARYIKTRMQLHLDA